MGAASVVEVDVSANPGPCFGHTGVGPEVVLLAFDDPLKALDGDVVTPRALAIRADLGLAMLYQSLLERLGAEVSVQCDRHSPGQDAARRPIDHRRQVDETPRRMGM